MIRILYRRNSLKPRAHSSEEDSPQTISTGNLVPAERQRPATTVYLSLFSGKSLPLSPTMRIIIQLLDMQSATIIDDPAKAYFRACQNRISSLDLVHAQLHRSLDFHSSA